MHDKNKIGKYLFPGIILICTIILIDQYSKWLVINGMLRKDAGLEVSFINWFFTHQPVDFFISERPEFNVVSFGSFLNMVMVWNQGISFGLFDSTSPLTALILIAISTTASLLMLIWLAFAEQKRLAFPLAMIIGGALGNVIDRIRFGAVADFIDVHIGDLHWPAFNIADASIAIGAGILIISTFIADRSKNDKTQ